MARRTITYGLAYYKRFYQDQNEPDRCAGVGCGEIFSPNGLGDALCESCKEDHCEECNEYKSDCECKKENP